MPRNTNVAENTVRGVQNFVSVVRSGCNSYRGGGGTKERKSAIRLNKSLTKANTKPQLKPQSQRAFGWTKSEAEETGTGALVSSRSFLLNAHTSTAMQNAKVNRIESRTMRLCTNPKSRPETPTGSHVAAKKVCCRISTNKKDAAGDGGAAEIFTWGSLLSSATKSKSLQSTIAALSSQECSASTIKTRNPVPVSVCKRKVLSSSLSSSVIQLPKEGRQPVKSAERKKPVATAVRGKSGTSCHFGITETPVREPKATATRIKTTTPNAELICNDQGGDQGNYIKSFLYNPHRVLKFLLAELRSRLDNCLSEDKTVSDILFEIEQNIKKLHGSHTELVPARSPTELLPARSPTELVPAPTELLIQRQEGGAEVKACSHPSTVTLPEIDGFLTSNAVKNPDKEYRIKEFDLSCKTIEPTDNNTLSNICHNCRQLQIELSHLKHESPRRDTARTNERKQSNDVRVELELRSAIGGGCREHLLLRPVFPASSSSSNRVAMEQNNVSKETQKYITTARETKAAAIDETSVGRRPLAASYDANTNANANNGSAVNMNENDNLVKENCPAFSELEKQKLLAMEKYRRSQKELLKKDMVDIHKMIKQEVQRLMTLKEPLEGLQRRKRHKKPNNIRNVAVSQKNSKTSNVSLSTSKEEQLQAKSSSPIPFLSFSSLSSSSSSLSLLSEKEESIEGNAYIKTECRKHQNDIVDDGKNENFGDIKLNEGKKPTTDVILNSNIDDEDDLKPKNKKAEATSHRSRNKLTLTKKVHEELSCGKVDVKVPNVIQKRVTHAVVDDGIAGGAYYDDSSKQNPVTHTNDTNLSVTDAGGKKSVMHGKENKNKILVHGTTAVSDHLKSICSSSSWTKSKATSSSTAEVQHQSSASLLHELFTTTTDTDSMSMLASPSASGRREWPSWP